MHHAAALSATLISCLCASLLAQPAKPSHCDPLVDVQTTGPGGYKERGDRCEGVYEQKVSGGTGLRIVSFTDTYPDFKFVPGDKLHLAWTAEGNPSLRLRATSLRSRHYYRMDSARPAGSDTWTWPADVLEQHQMSSRELGLFAVTRRAFGKEERDVYVPIRLGKNTAAPADRPYTLVVTPAVTLRQLLISLTPISADGTRGDPVVEDKDLLQGPYPSQRGVRTPLPAVPQRGYYVIEFTGLTDDSKPVSVELTAYLAR